jgi:hypothetical protein
MVARRRNGELRPGRSTGSELARVAANRRSRVPIRPCVLAACARRYLDPQSVWHELLGRKLITRHPLGGCCMADDARTVW